MSRYVGWRCPDGMYADLVAASARKERSVSQLLEFAVRSYLKTDSSGTPSTVLGRVEEPGPSADPGLVLPQVPAGRGETGSKPPPGSSTASTPSHDQKEGVVDILAAQRIASRIPGVTTGAMIQQPTNLDKVMAGLKEIPMCEISGVPRAACKRSCCTKHK